MIGSEDLRSVAKNIFEKQTHKEREESLKMVQKEFKDEGDRKAILTQFSSMMLVNSFLKKIKNSEDQGARDQLEEFLFLNQDHEVPMSALFFELFEACFESDDIKDQILAILPNSAEGEFIRGVIKGDEEEIGLAIKNKVNFFKFFEKNDLAFSAIKPTARYMIRVNLIAVAAVEHAMWQIFKQ